MLWSRVQSRAVNAPQVAFALMTELPNGARDALPCTDDISALSRTSPLREENLAAPIK